MARDSPPQAYAALVIDDDPSIRLMVRAALEQQGFAVGEAEDGATGLEAFDRARPDIVLLDVVMPGLDGFGVCTALRSRPGGERVPILMMTGLNDSDSINHAYQVGATDFVTKPITWAVLGYRLRYMLRSSQAFLDLAKSEARLANAQRIAHIGNWDLDFATGTLTGSEEVYRIFGCTRGDFPNTVSAFLGIVHPDDRQLVEESTYAALHRGEGYNIDFCVVLPDGSQRILNSQAEVVRGASGKPMQLVGTIQNITDRKAAEERISYLAQHDNLTGLANRQMFRDQAQHSIAQAERLGCPLAILILDLDRFKNVNDTFGHNIGDALLKEVANRLTHCVRKSDYIARADPGRPGDTVARLGGDEFTVLLTSVRHAEDSARMAQRALEVLAMPFLLGEHEVFITASIGIAVFPPDGGDADSLLMHADSAMYYAKQQGRNNYQFFAASMNEVVSHKLAVESGLRKALRDEQFVLYYQPQIDISNGKIVGAEALIRWQHPERGMVSPAEFIPVAEECGLIVPIGEWVLRTACAQASAWHKAGLAKIGISVNMASPSFQQANLMQVLAEALEASGLEPACLELEVTESMLMRDPAAIVETLKRVKAKGIKLSIDDFGTGYSSLSYLRHFPLDTLKIDRSFVSDICRGPDDGAITMAIIAMAKSLKLGVIAEGVETETQAVYLREQGCRYMQGYLFSRPVTADAMTLLLQQRVTYSLKDNHRGLAVA